MSCGVLAGARGRIRTYNEQQDWLPSLALPVELRVPERDGDHHHSPLSSIHFAVNCERQLFLPDRHPHSMEVAFQRMVPDSFRWATCALWGGKPWCDLPALSYVPVVGGSFASCLLMLRWHHR
jgi:hypothetical protein